QAAQALWEVDHPAERVVPTLLEGLKYKTPGVRRLCARVLAQIKPVPESAVPALRAALQDEDLAIRVNVAALLCSVPGQIKEAVPVLIPALKDRVFLMQAVQALGAAGPAAKEAYLPLLEALQEQMTDHIHVALIGSALEQIGGPEGVEAIG